AGQDPPPRPRPDRGCARGRTRRHQSPTHRTQRWQDAPATKLRFDAVCERTHVLPELRLPVTATRRRSSILRRTTSARPQDDLGMTVARRRGLQGVWEVNKKPEPYR